MSQASSKEKQKLMILNENMWKTMWQMSWPAIIAMVLYGLNTVFDAIFVGSFVGETAACGRVDCVSAFPDDAGYRFLDWRWGRKCTVYRPWSKR